MSIPFLLLFFCALPDQEISKHFVPTLWISYAATICSHFSRTTGTKHAISNCYYCFSCNKITNKRFYFGKHFIWYFSLPTYFKEKSLNFFLLWNELYQFLNQKRNQFLTISLWYSYYRCLLEPNLLTLVVQDFQSKWDTSFFKKMSLVTLAFSFLNFSLSSILFISLAALNMDACEALGIIEAFLHLETMHSLTAETGSRSYHVYRDASWNNIIIHQ